jgi:hypothetical protein
MVEMLGSATSRAKTVTMRLEGSLGARHPLVGFASIGEQDLLDWAARHLRPAATQGLPPADRLLRRVIDESIEHLAADFVRPCPTERDISRQDASPGSPSEGWERTRRAVIERDGCRCVRCGTTVGETAHVHHRLRRSEGGIDSSANLVTLCPDCHGVIHHRQAGAPGFVAACRALAGLDV